jgi:hypothetical protein
MLLRLFFMAVGMSESRAIFIESAHGAWRCARPDGVESAVMYGLARASATVRRSTAIAVLIAQGGIRVRALRRSADSGHPCEQDR